MPPRAGARSTSKIRRYRLYGLVLQCPLVLPCPRAHPHVRPDVRLRPGSEARFARARAAAHFRARRWFQGRRLADGTIYLCWTGNFEFLVSADGRRILYRRLEHASPESLAVYLLGQVLSFSLLARGRDPLHGTVVAVDGSAVAFLGDCGFGKSTLGAALLARGYRVIADDLVSLDLRKGRWVVHPGIPRLKLHLPVARALLGPEANGSAMIHGTSKRVLPLVPNQSVRQVLPLKAVYVLSDPRRRDDRSPPGGVTVEPVSGRDAFLEVIRAAFNLILLERGRYANQFAFATRLVALVPVRRLIYPRDLSVLPVVCRTVLADLASL
jgi:HPr Serine kinase C-terminal domain